MNRKTTLWALVATTVGMHHSPALAQQQLTPVSQQELSEVEEAVEDMGPLSASLRDLQPDFRQPTGFESVYRVPGRDDLLMRVSGGLHAVFPRSVYAHTPHGQVPLVPHGTTFFIGEPLPSFLPPQAGPLAVPENQILGDRYQAGQPHFSFEAMRVDPRVSQFSVGADTMNGESAGPWPHDQDGRVQAMQTPRLPRQGGAPVIRKDAPRTIATDESYRSQRLAELVRLAGAGE